MSGQSAEKDAGCPACGGDNLAAMLGSVWCNECDWIDPPERPIPPEEPCRCIAAGRGGVHYPSDHARRVIPPGDAERHSAECRRFADGHWECPAPHVTSPDTTP